MVATTATPARHASRIDDPERLEAAGHDEQLGAGHRRRHRLTVEPAHEMHVRRHAEGNGVLRRRSSSTAPVPAMTRSAVRCSAAMAAKAASRRSKPFFSTTRPEGEDVGPVRTPGAPVRGVRAVPAGVGASQVDPVRDDLAPAGRESEPVLGVGKGEGRAGGHRGGRAGGRIRREARNTRDVSKMSASSISVSP